MKKVDENKAMVNSQTKEIKHHADELSKVLGKHKSIESWVVGKIERASTDLSDVTHYLDGKQYAKGGGVGLKVSDLKKGDRLKKKGSAIEVDVLEVGNDWRSGYDYALIETPFGNPKSYIDVSDFVFSDGSVKPQYAKGGELNNNCEYTIGGL